MEGLFSLGIALLSHVEWQWIALITPFRLFTGRSFFSHSKQWLLVVVVVTHLKHFIWSTLAAVNPVSWIHLCGVCNSATAWLNVHVRGPDKTEGKLQPVVEWMWGFVYSLRLFHFCSRYLNCSRNMLWIRKLNRHVLFSLLQPTPCLCVLHWHATIMLLGLRWNTLTVAYRWEQLRSNRQW